MYREVCDINQLFASVSV